MLERFLKSMIKALKSLGQNFLSNKNIQKEIVKAANVAGKNIIEIGPGMGAITDQMADVVNRLVCIEFDKRLYEFLLQKNYSSNVEILNQDFLQTDLLKYTDFEVIGNIPYNITSDIIFKLLDNAKNINKITLMVQKEVADRICCGAGNSKYSKLAASIQLLYEPKYLFTVKAKEFNPAPKVDSAVIQLNLIKNNDFIWNNQVEILKFIKQMFQYKRKTLLNNFPSNLKQKISEFLKSNELDLNIRAEKITKEVSINLFKFINNKN
ncbi:16S rRNA (adenine(1518)-N(6)/adenine(1519)-N(6))-dimethyltransferase RsmA [Metamycoplasma hominis]|uniref:16S rRNA (adenine(1518)-N(6)/adenine(1519)-N(6))- dimethyltransferase RsmA n=1 Tax=Metamycoplasma hominis TaxID=2098 RepID=UPI0034A51DE1